MDQVTPNSAAIATIIGFMVVIAAITIFVSVFFTWCFWRIFAKAGYSGSLGLLCLVPSFGPVFCVLFLAFKKWPNEAAPARSATGHATPAVQ